MSEAARRILVVEDQRLIAADIENTLKKLGYVVVGNVASGEEAISKSDEVRPELVLMDVRLRGEMDGIHAAEVIRDRFNLPVVYLTAYADEETILRAKKTTPFGYLVKPFNERELRATVEIAFYTHQMERTLADERAKRRGAEEFKTLVDGVRDYAIFMLDGYGRVATWNSGAERLKGYKADEIIGKDFSVFYTEEEVQAGDPERLLETALRDGRCEEENWRVRKDGTRFWANVIITAIRNESGTPIGFAKVTRDLSERRLAEAQERQRAEEAAELRERLVAVVGHDLRQPLASIDIRLEVLRWRTKDPEFLEDLRGLRASSRRMSRMIEQILDFTRSRLGGGLEVVFAPMDLREALVPIVDELRAAQPSATIQLQCPELRGAWDRDRLEQVFSNLIGNALAHGDPGKPVTVTAGAEALSVWVQVHNEGPPIPQQFQPALFNPFRMGERLNRSPAGLGLGLYISNEVIQRHGGQIEVRSTAVEGTTFRVVLPREAVDNSGDQGGDP